MKSKQQEVLSKIDLNKIHTAKNEEIKEAADAFGLEYDPEQFPRGELITKLKEIAKQINTDGRIRKVIFHNTGEGSSSEVVVALNGRVLRYPKDVCVSIPENFLKVLDDAVEWRTEVVGNSRVRRRYVAQPYQIVE